MGVRVLFGLFFAVACGAAQNISSKIVSFTELAHKIPSAALKEARAADNALKKGDLDGVISHLEKVVLIDPAYVAAQRNLALAYLKTHQYDKAAPALDKLAELDPKSPLPYAGLSALYYNLNRMHDAEIAARRALDNDPYYELGHFLLGTTLALQGKEPQLALGHLTKALKHYPVAYVTKAGILARLGQRDEAKVEIEAYLDTGETDARPAAEELLRQLY